MATAIEWADDVWNPLLGCTKVSDGCTDCYAIPKAERNARFPKLAAAYAGLTRRFPDGSLNWTGRVRVLPDRLDKPRRWKKPRRIFVNSMSDSFHEAVADEFLDRIFAVMVEMPRHQYLILTKRPERMCDYVQGWLQRSDQDQVPGHIWLGVSIENDAYTWRADVLRKVPVPIRFISAEPLLTAVPSLRLDGISWVIVGGESGPHHRPMDPEWARGIRDQCVAAAVPFFFKQVGGITPKAGGRLLDGVEWNQYPSDAPEAGQ